MTQGPPLTRRFPLVPRYRPACGVLEERILEIAELATTAADSSVAARMSSAAEAQNKAALIASDCGVPDLARTLCWRQFAVFAAAAPLPVDAVQLALQPLINLGRLTLRGGDGGTAHRFFEDLYRAVRTRTTAIIEGRTIDAAELIREGEDTSGLTVWLWSTLLSDGTRSLVAAGRFDDALAHLERHNGIGRRLLDGRQVAILARCAASEPVTALALVEDSLTPTPWEESVAACLTVHCLQLAGRPADAETAAMIHSYRSLELADEHSGFHARLGLCVIDLTATVCGTSAPQITDLAHCVIHAAAISRDAYTTRDVLRHPVCRAAISAGDERSLTVIIETSRLRSGTIPDDLLKKLLTAFTTSEATLKATLKSMDLPVRPSQ